MDSGPDIEANDQVENATSDLSFNQTEENFAYLEECGEFDDYEYDEAAEQEAIELIQEQLREISNLKHELAKKEQDMASYEVQSHQLEAQRE